MNFKLTLLPIQNLDIWLFSCDGLYHGFAVRTLPVGRGRTDRLNLYFFYENMSFVSSCRFPRDLKNLDLIIRREVSNTVCCSDNVVNLLVIFEELLK